MFLGKYGTAIHIYVPVIKRGVVDFAVSADWTPAAGDVKISKDGGAAANVTNLPTAITMGNTAMWDFSLTATEMQAAKIMVTVADAATKAVEDTMFVVQTYGNASALLSGVDFSDAVRLGLTALPNANAGVNGGLATIDANLRTKALVDAYTAGQDSVLRRGTAQAGAAGTITLDSGASATDNFYNGASVAILSGTGAGQDRIVTGYVGATKVATVSRNWVTNPDATSVFIVIPAEVDVETWERVAPNALSSGRVDASVGAYPGNTAQTGDTYARLGAPAGASVSADIAAVKSDTGTVLTDVNTGAGAIYSRLGAPAGVSMSADVAAVKTELDAVKAKTDNLPASPASVSDIPTANANADALLDRANGVETSYTLRQSLRLMLSALAGKLSGAGTTTVAIRDVNDVKDRISATVDANGNRSAVTKDVT